MKLWIYLIFLPAIFSLVITYVNLKIANVQVKDVTSFARFQNVNQVDV